MTDDAKRLERGIRNCNPLNIVYARGNYWIGKYSNNTDGKFEQFLRIEFGIRAAIIILTRYAMRKEVGLYVPAIIHRWAPDGGEAEQNYIKFVTNKMAKLNMNRTRMDLKQLVSAMALFESRYTMSDFVFEKSFNIVPLNYRKFWI
ncbi:MAG: hypothetical protein J6I31_06405 [Prevotella sp.]|nr:hypothetical protein [Prevotella sp.]